MTKSVDVCFILFREEEEDDADQIEFTTKLGNFNNMTVYVGEIYI